MFGVGVVLVVEVGGVELEVGVVLVLNVVVIGLKENEGFVGVVFDVLVKVGFEVVDVVVVMGVLVKEKFWIWVVFLLLDVIGVLEVVLKEKGVVFDLMGLCVGIFLVMLDVGLVLKENFGGLDVLLFVDGVVVVGVLNEKFVNGLEGCNVFVCVGLIGFWLNENVGVVVFVGFLMGVDVDDLVVVVFLNEKLVNGLGVVVGVVEVGEDVEDWLKEKEGVEDVEVLKEKLVKVLDVFEGGIGEEVFDVGVGGIWEFGELVR